VAHILVADDEANLRKVLCAHLERDGHTAVAVADGRAALEALAQGGIDLVITDLKMPRMGGLELLRAIATEDPGLPVILITAHGTVDTAVSALKSGAFDYITKPFDKEELKLAVRKAAAVQRSSQLRLQDAGDPRGRFRIIGQSARMRDIYAIIEKIAATPSTVLISGESGTGKELVAAALHENSPRCKGPFIKVNCGAVPKDLMESEFFGYEQGAFTGAVGAKPGRFELADGGTLFLDEIGEIPVGMQVKLLRALQDSEFERVGGVRTLKVDVRIVAATNRDLLADIAAGLFRDDLYYRLNVVPVTLPALRDRREDIALLAQHFVGKYNKRLGKQVDSLSPAALQVLTGYLWPGNIRELENVIERTLLFCDHAIIELEDLPEDVRQASQLGTSPGRLLAPEADAAGTCASMKDIVRQATHHLERDLIVRALESTAGNVTRAAAVLQISRKGLQNKMKEFNLRDPELAALK
jgi:two-component system response regulator AtoC